MKQFIDISRSIFISPELVGLVLPITFWLYFPEPSELVVTLISGDLKWGVAAAFIPLGFLAACYNLGTDILSPKGGRKVLFEWPGYWQVKSRILVSMAYCIAGTLLSIGGLYWIAKHNASFGAVLIEAGLLASAISLGTVGLAKWTVREILMEE